MTTNALVYSLALLAASSLAAPSLAQDIEQVQSRPGGPPPTSPPRLPDGTTTEQMWAPPTEEDWKKPVLIEFQRTWGDAVTVAREANKPILVCINMDGEIASEHYAGVHYRTPQTAKLFEGYVCVIASVYRHTPRDHDEHGRRVLCPRFGSVTCGEHIAIEPILFAKFMDGQRISPRHIMVELDGREVYDVFYAWDNRSIIDTIEKGVTEREQQPRNVVRGDRPVVERVASRHVQDREAVEKAFETGDRELRRRLLEMAEQHPDATPVELLRLAVFSVDEDLARLGRRALVRVTSPDAVDVIAEALRAPLPDEEREPLLAALERLRDASPRARLLANVHRGLDRASSSVDLQRWSTAIAGGATYRPAQPEDHDQRLAASEAAVRADPADAKARLDLAEAALERAMETEPGSPLNRRQQQRFNALLLEDARRHAQQAEQAGASDWRLDAILALVAHATGNEAEARERVVRVAPKLPPEPASFLAVATLALFAQARIDGIWDALRKKNDWPGEWMTDVSSVYSVLAKHPLGTDRHAVTHYDFLDSLGAKRRAGAVLTAGLQRFPDSWLLHDRFRARVLDERGFAGLLPAYEELIAQPEAPPVLRWFAAYASLVVAEFHRRAGAPAPADAAYDGALAAYAAVAAAQPEWRESALHYESMALAGKARLAIERDELAEAARLMLAAIERCPTAMPTLDGLNITPAMTARLLETKLEAAGRSDALQELRAALAKLDPELLAPPEYETQPDTRPQRWRRR
jgi:hypothetical protein